MSGAYLGSQSFESEGDKYEIALYKAKLLTDTYLGPIKRCLNLLLKRQLQYRAKEKKTNIEGNLQCV